MTVQTPARVSVHGAHSGQFCSHAKDSLEDIVKGYVAAGFSWFGITEHMTPPRDEMTLPEEARLGMTAAAQYERFTAYFAEGRRLQRVYADRITIFLGFETEWYTGAAEWIGRLIETFKPDYLVGSVHHVEERLFDATPEGYQNIAASLGGIEALYCRYFDHQYDLITTIRPAVVGHFDVIRIFDANYPSGLVHPQVWNRIERNLEAIRDTGAIMDFNLRALYKGQPEPYVSGPILRRALEMGIALAPGDDAHSADSVGANWDRGMAVLREAGASTDWKRPA